MGILREGLGFIEFRGLRGFRVYRVVRIHRVARVYRGFIGLEFLWFRLRVCRIRVRALGSQQTNRWVFPYVWLSLGPPKRGR